MNIGILFLNWGINRYGGAVPPLILDDLIDFKPECTETEICTGFSVKICF